MQEWEMFDPAITAGRYSCSKQLFPADAPRGTVVIRADSRILIPRPTYAVRRSLFDEL